jgi:hypothetical protein
MRLRTRASAFRDDFVKSPSALLRGGRRCGIKNTPHISSAFFKADLFRCWKNEILGNIL